MAFNMLTLVLAAVLVWTVSAQWGDTYGKELLPQSVGEVRLLKIVNKRNTDNFGNHDWLFRRMPSGRISMQDHTTGLYVVEQQDVAFNDPNLARITWGSIDSGTAPAEFEFVDNDCIRTSGNRYLNAIRLGGYVLSDRCGWHSILFWGQSVPVVGNFWLREVSTVTTWASCNGQCTFANFYGTGRCHSDCNGCPAAMWRVGTRCTCAGGYHMPAGSAGCRVCGAGHKGLPSNRASACQPCSAGTYQPYTGQSLCYTCPNGEYQPYTGRSSCYTCPTGEFSTRGQSRCTMCPAGEFQPLEGQVACQTCPAGEFQPLEGQAACRSCSAGEFQPLEGQADCSPCSAGEFQPLDGQAACQACPAGEFQPLEGQTTCQTCPAGTFSTSGEAMCTKCPVGYFQPTTGETTCQVCPAGMFQPLEGQAACRSCERGSFRYSANESELRCKLCPVRKSSGLGATECYSEDFEVVDPLQAECPADQAVFSVIRTGVMGYLADVVSGTSLLGDDDQALVLPRIWQCSLRALPALRSQVAPLDAAYVEETLDGMAEVFSNAAKSSELPDDQRAMAMRLLVVWSVVPHFGGEDGFTAASDPPALLLREDATEFDSLDDLLVSDFKDELLGGVIDADRDRIKAHLSARCFHLAVSLAQCECRLEYDAGSKTCIETTETNDEMRWLVMLQLAGYCATSKDLAGSDVAFRTVTRAAQCLKDDLWQQRLQRQRLRAALDVQAAAIVMAEVGTRPAGLKPPVTTLDDGVFSMVLVHEREGCAPVFEVDRAELELHWGGLPLDLRVVRVELQQTHGNEENQVAYYRQTKSDLGSWDPVHGMTEGWDPEGTTFGKRGVDFDVYSTAMDAFLETDGWDDCDPDAPDGFPSNCRPTGQTDPTVVMSVPAKNECSADVKTRIFVPFESRDAYELLGTLEGVVSDLSDQVKLMTAYDAVGLTVLGSACRTGICDGSLEDIKDELVKVQILDAIERSSETMRQLVYRSWKSLRIMVASTYEDTQEGLRALGQLVVNVAEIDADQEADNMQKMADFVEEGIVNLYRGHEGEALGRHAVDRADLAVTMNKLNSVLQRVDTTRETFQATLDDLGARNDQLDASAEEFYECRKQDELAELANKRRNALFNAIVNGLQAVVEVGVAIYTGGTSTKIKSMSNADKVDAFTMLVENSDMAGSLIGSRGNKPGRRKRGSSSFDDEELEDLFEDKAKEKAKELFTDVLDSFSGGGGGESGEGFGGINLAEKVSASVDLLEQGYDFFADPDDKYTDAGQVMGVLGTMSQAADFMGVPGAGAAAAMFNDLSFFFNSEVMEEEIEDKYERDAKAASDAYDALAVLLKRVADFASGMILEFFYILSSASPPPGISAADSLPLLVWDEMYENIEQFLLSTQVYVDMQSAASGRRLLLDVGERDEEDQVRVDVVARLSLRRQLPVSQLPDVSDADPVRRALLFKEPLPEPCGELAKYGREGVNEIHAYLAKLARAVENAKEMHTSLREVVTLAGRAKVLRIQARKNFQDARRWVVAREQLEAAQQEMVQFRDTPEAAEYTQARRDAFDVFEASLPMVMREVPELQAPVPAGAKRFRKETEPDGLLTRLCRQSQYTFLETPSQCQGSLRDAVDASDPAKLEVQNDEVATGVGAFLEAAGDELGDLTGSSPDKKWLRVPVASSALLRSRLGAGLGEATTVGLDLIRGKHVADIISCGHNIELESAVVALERVSQDSERHQRLLAVPQVSQVRQVADTSDATVMRLVRRRTGHADFDPNRDWAAQVQSLVDDEGEAEPQLIGLKTTKDGTRELFVLKDSGYRGSPDTHISDSACTGSYVGPRLHEGSYICAEEIDSLRPTPILARYEVALNSLVASIQSPDDVRGEEGEDLQLVVYLQASIHGFNAAATECPLSREVVPPPERPEAAVYDTMAPSPVPSPAPSTTKIEVQIPGKKKILMLCEVEAYDSQGNKLQITDAKQSSTQSTFGADLALDGRLGPAFFADPDTRDAQCTRTKKKADPYWKAKIQAARDQIHSIQIFNRDKTGCRKCPRRLKGAEVILDGVKVFTVPNAKESHLIVVDSS